MTYVCAGLSVVVVIQAIALALMWRRRARSVATVEARVRQLADALALLTDTTQAGLASVAAELEHGRRPRPTTRAATSRRIAHAVERGRTVRDVAAQEQVSESEIRLHLGLASECTSGVHGFGTTRRSWLEPSTSR